MASSRLSPTLILLLGAIVLQPLVACQAGSGSSGQATGAAVAAPAVPAPAFGDAFWKQWGDGRAELNGYDLTFPRYGHPRRGVAVAVFVTETFSHELRVKADPGRHPATDEFPVMKLNLVQDFSTGIYDYNLMTSAFVALAPVAGRPAGTPTKVSFSSQEWCGNIYSQLLFDEGSARYTLHSYFDGEADREERLTVPDQALDADALLLWARGFTVPVMESGETRAVSLVRSLQTSRLRHRPMGIGKATLAVDARRRTVKVPAGSFEVRARTVAIEGGATWTFLVETAEPHRIVAWESTDGERAELRGSARLKYWEMNGPGGESALAKLGLEARAPHMP